MRKIRLKVKSKSYKVCLVQTSWLPDGLSYSDHLLKRPSSSSSSSSSHLSLCFSVGLRAERVMTDASVFEPEPDWLWVPAHRQIKRLSIVYILNQDSWTVFKSVEFVSKSFKVMTHQKTHLRYQRTHPVLTKDCGLNSTISSNKSKNWPFFRGGSGPRKTSLLPWKKLHASQEEGSEMPWWSFGSLAGVNHAGADLYINSLCRVYDRRQIS